ncbi:MAG: hypothetical protein HC849_10545 [Oscillatoriales cyanobacterium RU_3_3]|nr:hypothetical protein [Microcoleus sp. SU_5_6]NJM60531.1 hypothetical protein [Oscillatoriales cyanobacterium RU_3_3]NJR22727.1 hypothetical protein [Richelia sp. CSU_2_1]
MTLVPTSGWQIEPLSYTISQKSWYKGSVGGSETKRSFPEPKLLLHYFFKQYYFWLQMICGGGRLYLQGDRQEML